MPRPPVSAEERAKRLAKRRARYNNPEAEAERAKVKAAREAKRLELKAQGIS